MKGLVKRKSHGVSTILMLLVLMLAVIIIGVIFYVYVISYSKSLGKESKEKTSEVKLKVEGVKVTGNQVILYVHNIGGAKAKIDKIYFLDPVTQNIVAAVNITPVTINPGETKSVVGEIPQNLKKGEYILAVGSAEGARASYMKAVTVYPKAVELHVAFLAGSDLGNLKYGVKKAEVKYSVQAGANVTYIELTVPVNHWVRFSPVAYFTVDRVSSVRLVASSIASGASVDIVIKLKDSTQIVVDDSVIKQNTGNYVNVASGEKVGFTVKVLVGSGAKLGSTVATLETVLEVSGKSGKSERKIVWIIKTFSTPPKVVLFSDSFENGNLNGWSKTKYVYAKKKTGTIIVYDHCPGFRKVKDKTLPISGSWLMMLGHRDLYCEPWPSLNDYASVSIKVPSEIDGVEVKTVKVTLYVRVLSWDSAYFDYVTVSVKVGGKTYYLLSRYNPNPGYSYGPFRDSGWKHLTKTIEGVGGAELTLKILLHTFSDNWLKTWVYVDDVKVVIEFG